MIKLKRRKLARHHPPGWCNHHGHGHPIHVLYCGQAIVWGLRNHFPVKALSAAEELAALVVFDKPDVVVTSHPLLMFIYK